jgi:hypothetical protein
VENGKELLDIHIEVWKIQYVIIEVFGSISAAMLLSFSVMEKEKHFLDLFFVDYP